MHKSARLDIILGCIKKQIFITNSNAFSSKFEPANQIVHYFVAKKPWHGNEQGCFDDRTEIRYEWHHKLKWDRIEYSL